MHPKNIIISNCILLRNPKKYNKYKIAILFLNILMLITVFMFSYMYEIHLMNNKEIRNIIKK